MNVSEEDLRAVLAQNQVPNDRIARIVDALRPAPAERFAASVRTSAPFLIIVSDPRLQGIEAMGWCVRTDDVPPGEARTALLRAGIDFNNTQRGRRNPVATLGDIMDGVPARILRERGIRRLHKEPCFVEVVASLDASGTATAAEAEVRPAPAHTVTGSPPDGPAEVPGEREVPADPPPPIQVVDDSNDLTA